jgi:hypothetical protein
MLISAKQRNDAYMESIGWANLGCENALKAFIAATIAVATPVFGASMVAKYNSSPNPSDHLIAPLIIMPSVAIAVCGLKVAIACAKVSLDNFNNMRELQIQIRGYNAPNLSEFQRVQVP